MSTRPTWLRPVAWTLLVGVTVAAMAFTWRQEEQQRRHLERLKEQGFKPTARRIALDRLPASWQAVVISWNPTMTQVTAVAQVGILVLGAGLCVLTVQRRPRPGPGRIASAVAASVLVLALLIALRSTWADPYLTGETPSVPDPAIPGDFWTSIADFGGQWLPLTVAVAWIALAASGQWRRSPTDGIERMGRILGWTWIGLALTVKALFLLGIMPNDRF